MFTKIGILTLLLLSLTLNNVYAVQYNLKGQVTDSLYSRLGGASISLLDPSDSTLVTFGITNAQGFYTLTAVKEGSYLLQVALMGYYTQYKSITVNDQMTTDLGIQVLAENEQGSVLDEVIVSGEKIPIRLKGDTLEYNAGSFKVKPDAVVEDLLKKMPGIEVDKNGNIKSMGKAVNKILVDGKEFFGDDPKVATKNLPADAVDKVQAFEKKSDASLFSGIDDGEREQTLNLVLKDGKKTGYFGETKAGGGTPEKYEASLKAFKFRPKSQLAAMGMLNNINKFGFSFEDYFNFNGGLKSLVGNGGEIRIDGDEMPIDAGQPVTGNVNSGAFALNYMAEPDAHNRLSFNYMGNGMDKLLDQYTNTKNFIPDGTFATEKNEQSKSANLANRASAKWRQQVDSAHFMTFNLYGLLGSSKQNEQSFSESYRNIILENDLDNYINNKGKKTEAGADFTWLQKQKGSWPVLKAVLQGGYKKQSGKEFWRNRTVYINPAQEIRDEQYRNYTGIGANGSATLSAVRTLGKGYFLEPSSSIVLSTEMTDRKQGPLNVPDMVTDSLSPAFTRNVVTWSNALTLKRNQKTLRWNMGLQRKDLWLNPVLNGQSLYQKHYGYFLPSIFWEKDQDRGKRITLSYNTSVAAPDAAQLMPVTDYSNPLMLTKGNEHLKPEYNHTVNAMYFLFDQFNMSSFSASLRGSYTNDKIAYARTISSNLAQQLQLVNTPYEVSSQLSLDYSRPINSIGLNIHTSISETWAQSLNPVNSINNKNNTLSHKLDLSFSNISSDVWDLHWGGNINISDSRYSINKEMNNQYYNYSGFAQIGYRPTAKWNFTASGDITHYTARSFDHPVTVPIVSAEITRYIFANQRGAISLRAFDLLDRNKSVQRISQLNYLMEQRSNTIGRYAVLSFSYRLNKAGTPGSISVQR
ncbi:TonB-dependent receptor [Edaphocola aurantiacus]|uniref:TonB-dependent receptor n=1 Tax=Edaphocola aurantiacus TaxID=2601682 RepID=UPI001C96E31F|nr:TonB-dependent receptor [Edaphocola aurantiacus]